MNLYKNILKTIIISLFINFPILAFAADIDHFKVVLEPTEVSIWQSIDITITAVDKDSNIVKDYDWSILIFSQSDPEVDFPTELKENSYIFTPADEWEIKFENAIIFNNAWLQDIYVYDLNDDNILWIAEIDITKKTVKQNIEIEILSPETWVTIWEKKITVSWKTNKNHKVIITVNWTNEIITNTNSDGIFEEEITGLNDWENQIKAKVLNSDEETIWDSNIVNIMVSSWKPVLKSLKISPQVDVEPESEILVELISNPGLIEVSVIINDNITKLTEDGNSWVYKWSVSTPKEAWEYSVDTILKDELGHEIKELSSESISVKKIELQAATGSIIEDMWNILATNTWTEKINNNTGENIDLTITWLKVVWLKTKSILTWDAIEWVESYSVYQKLEDDTLELIDITKEAIFKVDITWDEVKYDYFLVKATAKTASWILYEWDLSKAIKIKTGPEIFILLLISIIIGWLFFWRKRAQLY